MQSRSFTVVAALCLLTACDDSTGPDNLAVQFGEPISVSQLESDIDGTARIEIEFTDANGLVAREIEVEPDDAEEKITSRVIAMNTAAGTLTLELGNLVVTYNSATRFRTVTNSNVSRASWEGAIAAALNADETPAIEVRRNQPSEPQAPTVATFTADDLRITDDFDDAKIEVYVDADNFTEDPSPPPLAVLRVFNLPVQILTTTRIQRVLNGAPQSGSVQFEGQITAVNASESTLTLADGTVIQLGTSTTFDPEGDLVTLNATASAVTSGDAVRVEGLGTIESAGPPRTITATRVKIEVDD